MFMNERDPVFFILMFVSSLWFMSLDYFQYRLEKRCKASGTTYSRRFRIIGFTGAVLMIGAAVFVRFQH